MQDVLLTYSMTSLCVSFPWHKFASIGMFKLMVDFSICANIAMVRRTSHSCCSTPQPLGVSCVMDDREGKELILQSVYIVLDDQQNNNRAEHKLMEVEKSSFHH